MKKIYFLVVFLFFYGFAKAQIINFPDSGLKNRLLFSSTNSGTAQDFNDNNIAIDSNNDGEIEIAEALIVKKIDLNQTNFINNIYNMTGIEQFTNLRYLNFWQNQVTSLNINSLQNLEYLNCGKNEIANLDVSNLTQLKQLYCQANEFTTLDLSMLTNLLELDYGSNPQLTSINYGNSLQLEKINCYGNNLNELNFSSYTNLNYLDCSYNQLTSLILGEITSLTYLDTSNNPQLALLNHEIYPSLYYLNCSNNLNTINGLNINGLTDLIELHCANLQLTSLDVSTNVNLWYIDCSNNLLTTLDTSNIIDLSFGVNCNNNQLITLNLRGIGQSFNPTFTFLSYNNNPSLQYICIRDNMLTLQEYLQYYNQQANINAEINSYCSFEPGGIIYLMEGVSKYDNNSNGCDTNDIIYPFLNLDITDGTNNVSIYSNNYSIPVPAGTHTITPFIENASYFNIFPASATVTFPDSSSPFLQNFCITPNGEHHDLEVVSFPLSIARPGFDTNYSIKYKNKGTSTENVTISFAYDDTILDFVVASITPTSQNIGLLTWNIGNVSPFEFSNTINVTLNLNSATETPPVNSGNILNYTTTISSLNTDETPIDNISNLNQTVVNSFDPNDKTCLEGSILNANMIGQYLHYMIRFENTGTTNAQNIVVKDLIDTTKFDINSLQIVDSSHSSYTKINGNKAEFIFENINLPFENANNDGFIIFKIKTKPTLIAGDQINNNASIYFDYNFPITTNTATSTFQTLENDNFEFNNYFTLSPNPTKNNLTIISKQNTKIASVSIYTILGQLVLTTINPTETIDVSGLQAGNYFIKIISDSGITNSKFIKE